MLRPRETVKAAKAAGAIPERPRSSAPKAQTPLNEGSRLSRAPLAFTSDGGEANPIILAEQPGDDARAGTVSTRPTARLIGARGPNQGAAVQSARLTIWDRSIGSGSQCDLRFSFASWLGRVLRAQEAPNSLFLAPGVLVPRLIGQDDPGVLGVQDDPHACFALPASSR
jgi:hypothetical protein